MKNIRLLFIPLFFVNLFFSQTNQPMEVNPYFPIQIGNYWVFSGSTALADTIRMEIIGDTVLANNKMYYQFDNDFLCRFIRTDDTNIYVYNIDEDKEDTLYRFDKHEGDSWDVRYRGFSQISVSYVFNDTILGYPTNLIMFKNDGLGGVSYSTFSDKFGYYYNLYTGEPPGTSHDSYELIKCKISNEIYLLLPTSVGEDDPLRNNYYLLQNYPNPFNPTTKIVYSLSKSADIKLILYDSIGKQIGLLDSGFKSKGKYEINFDAISLTSGVYFYQLITNERVITKKMLLLR